MRLQPIRVYCLHHISTTFDAESMKTVDWMQIDDFKRKVLAMQENGVEFISLAEAYRHISNDWVRYKKFAVLTFDDGYVSLKEILPWLEDRHIPVTLFINGKYLDEKSYRENPKERYLAKDELFAMTSQYIAIGSHGWEHIRATKQTEKEFEESIEKNVKLLSRHPRYIPYHAYTYGDYNSETDDVLCRFSNIPVLIDGVDNYNDKVYIHRRLL